MKKTTLKKRHKYKKKNWCLNPKNYNPKKTRATLTFQNLVNNQKFKLDPIKTMWLNPKNNKLNKRNQKTKNNNQVDLKLM